MTVVNVEGQDTKTGKTVQQIMMFVINVNVWDIGVRCVDPSQTQVTETKEVKLLNGNVRDPSQKVSHTTMNHNTAVTVKVDGPRIEVEYTLSNGHWRRIRITMMSLKT